jgi:hypothetical protein
MYREQEKMKFIIGNYEQERCTGISACCLECIKNEKYPPWGKAAFVQKAVFALIE